MVASSVCASRQPSSSDPLHGGSSKVWMPRPDDQERHPARNKTEPAHEREGQQQRAFKVRGRYRTRGRPSWRHYTRHDGDTLPWGGLALAQELADDGADLATAGATA